MRHQFCGTVRFHNPHPWRPVWRRWSWPGGRHTGTLYRPGRWCEGAYVERCGREKTHPPHWWGELRIDLCPGEGLAGVCPHGVQNLNACPAC